MKEQKAIPNLLMAKHKNTIEVDELTPVDCNLCGSSTGANRVLFTEAEDFDILACRSCGLLYVSPQPQYEDLHKYYEGFFSDADNTSSDEWLHDSALAQVRAQLQLSNDRSSVLEVGSGHGHFLRMAHDMGFQRIVGVEPDTETSQKLSEELTFAEVINSTIEEVQSDEKFTCIVMLASLEHFKDPSAVLSSAFDLLEEGGMVLIRVPFWEGYFRMNALLHRNLFPFGAPRHLFDFSPRTLGAMLEKAGFRDTRVLPGAKEKHESIMVNLTVTSLKMLFTGLWYLTGKRYISAFTGSIVATAIKR